MNEISTFLALKETVMGPIQSLATEISGGDTVVKGLVTMWMVTTVFFLFRSLPGKLYAYITRMCMISIRIESQDRSRYTEVVYSIVSERIAKTKVYTKKFRLRRARSFDHDAPDSMALDTDFGQSWFIHKGRVFFVTRERSEKQMHTSDENIVVSTIGFSPKVFDFLLRDLEPPVTRSFYVNNRNNWRFVRAIKETTQLVIDPVVKHSLDKKLADFKNNRKWYIERNIPWKLTILLYGPPGTGKTSLVRYIADYLERSLYSMSLSTVAKGDMMEMLSDASHNNGVVAIEDFDISGAANKRSSIDIDDDSPSDVVHSHSSAPAIGSNRPHSSAPAIGSNRSTYATPAASGNALAADLYDMLNSFQGLIPLDGVVTVLTTNHIEKIDPALLRSGRIDLKLEIKALKFDQIVEFYKTYYNTDSFPSDTRLETAEVKGCDLFDAFNNNRQSPEDFIITLQKHTGVTH